MVSLTFDFSPFVSVAVRVMVLFPALAYTWLRVSPGLMVDDVPSPQLTLMEERFSFTSVEVSVTRTVAVTGTWIPTAEETFSTFSSMDATGATFLWILGANLAREFDGSRTVDPPGPWHTLHAVAKVGRTPGREWQFVHSLTE